MKFTTASTLLFATLALASPAPAAQPAAIAVAQPVDVAQREAAPAPVDFLEERAPKKPKGGSGGNKTNNTSAASEMMTPSRALQLGALGLGVMEVVRLW